MEIKLNEQQAIKLISVLENPFLTTEIADRLNKVVKDKTMTTVECTDYELKFVIS